MQKVYEHLEYGTTTNRAGEKVYFARIYFKKKELTTEGYHEITASETIINKDRRELGKLARTRYRFYHPKKTPGRNPQVSSTYKGATVIMFAKRHNN